MYFELAKRNLMRTRVRSVLAIIGIVIGVMAIASIGIFGEGLKLSVLKNFQDVANEVIITPSYTHGYTKIDRDSVKKIEKLTFLESVTPIKMKSGVVQYKNKKTYTTIYGMGRKDIEEMFKAEKGSIKLSGSCVVGNYLAEKLNLRVGVKLSIEGEVFRVSGILEEEGARFDINPNNAIFISEKDFENLFNEKDYSMVIVRVEKIENIEELKDAVDKLINSRETKVRVFEMKTIIERITEAFNQINLFLLAIAGISLLVAGVSILNIMLISTIERTREIGVMRAVGASRQTIMRVFLYEALILGAIGSVIGGILSIFAGFLIEAGMLHTVEYLFVPSTFFAIAKGIFFGMITAVISGFYPAWKASNLEPIEALRYE
ncbi:ABC-type transport system, involved in lipoprotein release, permease component [Archaeoglobus sulfaticallidus PM70-1]|uniref:ABC-type transport system, involved in lipoprotein release, permease component n=1 Tax=Archaeoglobus sulfaticallidus PM70-1 TaxID=387631 RepID=N0BIV0_9EURY|nr:ABC transporter permease [Archaeoglobus sulfaticallidus]AGK60401.1 ABC-type transport system, involved in lipoprotein release, permease component [Archaeoglobus sulfaticallidus PM70-1]